MDTRLIDFDYAPDITKVYIKQIICLVATPVCLDHSTDIHVLASVPQGVHFRFEGNLEPGLSTYTLLRIEVIDDAPLPTFRCTEKSMLWGHPSCTMEDALNLTEVCAGIGALAKGTICAGFKPVLACEIRPKLAALYRLNSTATVIEGDLLEFCTLQKMFQAHPRSTSMAAGISCQPYSRLGDNKSSQDVRSQTLPGTLACAHYLRSILIVLECVEPAAVDPYVTWQIQQFCLRTGFHKKEVVLHLSDAWPCRRSRWWCVLSAPALGPIQLRPLPKLFDVPSIRHVLPHLSEWPIEEERQLKLTAVEIEAFKDESGSASKYLINMKGQLPCALHSWGSQVTACPCGCRSVGLSPSCLQHKGLFGVLARCHGIESANEGGNQAILRHLHPCEAALLCGLDPAMNWGDDMRLALGGIGQLASPVHANWIFQHVRFALQQAQYGSSKIAPQAELQSYRSWLVARAQIVWTSTVAEMIPSEALQEALRWKPYSSLGLEEIVQQHGSLHSCIRMVTPDTKVSTDSVESVTTDLTLTQVAIPSPVEDSDEEMPASEPRKSDISKAFSIQVCVSDPSTVASSFFPVKVGQCATVAELVEAEMCLLGKTSADVLTVTVNDRDATFHDELQVDCMVKLTIKPPVVQGSPISSPAQLPKCNQDMNFAPHPLTQVKGIGFLALQPPQVVQQIQVDALRSQNVLKQDRLTMMAQQDVIWGDDELFFHFSRIVKEIEDLQDENNPPPAILDPLLAWGWCCSGDAVSHNIVEWFQRLVKPEVIFTALLHRGHWIPIAIAVDDKSIEVVYLMSEEAEQAIVSSLIEKIQIALGSIPCAYQTVPYPTGITGCGVIVVAFMEHFFLQRQFPPLDVSMLFASYRTHLCQQPSEMAPHPWMWGAGIEQDRTAVESLVPLFKEHIAVAGTSSSQGHWCS